MIVKRGSVDYRSDNDSITVRFSPPFTDWQNDLHLNVGTAHGIFLCSCIDLATLIDAVTR